MTPQHAAHNTDQQAIDELVQAFFNLFTNRSGATPNLRAIFELCVPEAVIASCANAAPKVTSLEAFIAPREALLSDGTLTDFHEVEVTQQTQIFGNVAQRCCVYGKSGILNGARFSTRGVKLFQLIRRPEGWRITAVSWDDERDGFSLDAMDSTPLEVR